MEQNLRVFTGKSASAESTVMPAVHSWIAESLGEIAEVKSSEDHAIIGWLCLPTAGVIGAQKWDFFVTFVCNFLAQHSKNGIVLIVHSNRASQMKCSPKEKIERSLMGSWAINLKYKLYNIETCQNFLKEYRNMSKLLHVKHSFLHHSVNPVCDKESQHGM